MEVPVTLPPKVSVLAETVKIGLPEIARDDVPMLRLLPPVGKVKEPVTEPAPAPVRTLALPEELFSVPPEIASVPPPRAPVEFRFRVPAVIDRPPEKVLAPESVSDPPTSEAEAKPLSPLKVAVPELMVTVPPIEGLLPEAVSVPPLSVKAPLMVFAPDRVRVAEVPVSDVRVLLPVITKVVPEAAVTAPMVPPVPIFRMPAFKANVPSTVTAPEIVNAPLPALVSPKLPAPSVREPTVRTREAVETVAVKDCPRVATPVPKLRSWVPVKVKEPFQFVALFAKVSAATEELSRMVRAPTVSAPVPRASAEPSLSVPAPIVTPPLPVFVPESVSVPAPVLRTGAPKLTLPVTFSEEVPVPSTDQVWLRAPPDVEVTSGAEIVTAPAFAATTMPPEVLTGATVNAPPVPEESRKEVVGVEVALMNCSPSIV